MPVPFEALLPLGIIAGMFTVTGTMVGMVQRIKTGGKPQRYGLDNWDRAMMARDQRLTGDMYKQNDNPIAPPEFSTNGVVYLRKIA
ncbi:hypothetical protein BKA69DRAFT_1032379 [Paraphysoderma sedebokerense]|nr:hypothetical protein BKA69DRAFT_1032379 [Paraphysoderma sedebokerense]